MHDSKGLYKIRHSATLGHRLSVVLQLSPINAQYQTQPIIKIDTVYETRSHVSHLHTTFTSTRLHILPFLHSVLTRGGRHCI